MREKSLKFWLERSESKTMHSEPGRTEGHWEFWKASCWTDVGSQSLGFGRRVTSCKGLMSGQSGFILVAKWNLVGGASNCLALSWCAMHSALYLVCFIQNKSNLSQQVCKVVTTFTDSERWSHLSRCNLVIWPLSRWCHLLPLLLYHAPHLSCVELFFFQLFQHTVRKW